MHRLLTPGRLGLSRRLVVAFLPAFAAVAAMSGGAYAYFTSTGNGTGSAQVGTLPAGSVVLVAAASTPSNPPLVPGGTSDLVFTIKNANAFNVSLFSVQGTAAGSAVSGNIGTCTTSGVTVPLNTPAGFILTPGTHNYDIPGAAHMGTTAGGNPSDTGCQGATFHIPLTIVVHK